jgi:hypothetical protein
MIYKNLPLDPILSQQLPVHTFTSYLGSILILFSHLHLGLPSCLFRSDFPTKMLSFPSTSACYTSHPSHLMCVVSCWSHTNSWRSRYIVMIIIIRSSEDVNLRDLLVSYVTPLYLLLWSSSLGWEDDYDKVHNVFNQVTRHKDVLGSVGITPSILMSVHSYALFK